MPLPAVRSKVDGFVPHTQDVNLRIVCQAQGGVPAKHAIAAHVAKLYSLDLANQDKFSAKSRELLTRLGSSPAHTQFYIANSFSLRIHL